MEKYLFCCYREHFIKLYHERLSKLPYDIELLTDHRKLSLDFVSELNPKYIFFPDWSWLIPKEIIENAKCICFHEAPLPYFRGGSPIQNQIARGVKNTKITAFIMDEGIDTGDIVLQEDLNLEGHLRDIFARITDKVYHMVCEIINGNYDVRKQVGEGSYYKRRTPEESQLPSLSMDLDSLYDFIRMLEDPYPNAFMDIDDKRLIFKEAEMLDGEIHFKGIIKKK
ncbi:MAG: formyltransferase family protein [Clostridia bacterium]|nr:formyltransferase family protein [Clostridia bacterium]